MDCMQSFSIRINASTVFDDTNGGVRTWGPVGEYYWSAYNYPTLTFSVYKIIGFKNVNIYGVSVNGYVTGEQSGLTSCAIVSDWNFLMRLNGTAQLISGEKNTAQNGWDIKTTSPDLNKFSIGKYTPSLNLASPFVSVSSIEFEALVSSGIACTLPDVVYLGYDLYFTFYYKYEGED